MKRKRIVHVIESASGGSLQYVIQICQQLDPTQWDVTVIHSRRSDTPVDLAAQFPSSVRLIELPMTREIAPFQDGRAIITLRRWFQQLRPDLIHLHSSKAGVVGRIAAWGLKKTVLYTPHGFAFIRKDVSPKKRFAYRAIERLMAKWCPGVLLVGSKEEERQARRFVSQQRVRLVLNAVAVPEQPQPLFETGFWFGTVGRITAAKNPLFLLEVVEEVYKRVPYARFVWIGDGEERAALEQAAVERGLTITVTGWLDRQAVQGWLTRLTAYVQASLWEGLPFALLEAMAVGRPLVASDIPAHRDVIVEGNLGWIGKDANELAGFLQQLLIDRDRAVQMGAAAWRNARDYYSKDVFERGICRVYLESVERG